MGLIPVATHQVACVVTSLEMLERPRARPMPQSILRLNRWTAPAADKYRQLFRRIGAPWLWFSRLIMDEARLIAIIHDPLVEIYAVCDRQGIEVGILELDFRKSGECELGFFGLIPELAGQGHGGWLMAQAMALGWRKGITRLWVHTCTLDSPGALGFYQKAGFKPFARSVETFDDPRVLGILPRDTAPHVPMLQAAS
ncbi:GNAT family N-acetyltransferase [Sphingobium boeckii]|uniref:GNAT superfamily N-acetyltransferase n=1 Tax=Sphingobium boeckii TaxID=1082345 RepID=A0A7W9AK46_9SPHN|nr:GNAT superfamily N-acetyltransferase [Sphingobium boeckii]